MFGHLTSVAPRLAGLVLAALVGVACGEEPPPPEVVARPVKLLTLGGAGFRTSLEYPGEIRPLRQADMAFEVPGRLVEFPVGEGQVVQEGHVLARLDPRDYEQELEQAAAMLRQSRTEMERYAYLYEQGVNPQRDYEVRQRNFEVSQAQHAIARKALEDTLLRAPFDGIVARKLVEDFATVPAKEPVLVLQDASRLRIRVSVPERDFVGPRTGESLAEVSERLSPRVVLSARPDRAFPATLTEVSTAADPTTRTYQATLTFDPPEEVNVMPGMTAKVRIDGFRRPDVQAPLLIPSVAVVGGPDGPFVWVVDTDSMTVRKVPVEVGPLHGGWLEIRDGLEKGQTIATSGVHQLRDGMPVRRYES